MNSSLQTCQGDNLITWLTDLVAYSLFGRKLKGGYFMNMFLELPMKFTKLCVSAIHIPFHTLHTYKYLRVSRVSLLHCAVIALSYLIHMKPIRSSALFDDRRNPNLYQSAPEMCVGPVIISIFYHTYTLGSIAAAGS